MRSREKEAKISEEYRGLFNAVKHLGENLNKIKKETDMEMMKGLKKTFILLIALLLSVLPFYIMLIKGVYRWHISQPEFVEGGIELIILAILILIGWSINKHRIVSPLVAGGIIYLIHHGVIIPFLTDVTYIILLAFIGFCFFSKKYKSSLSITIIKSIISGMTLWVFGAIVLSLIGCGTINDLRIYTLVLVILSWIKGITNHKFDKCEININEILNKKNDFSEAVCIIMISAVIICLFAKTNTAQDYDSLWYGLRSQYVLVGNNSFYDDLGYLSFVYYYPKLAELLWLPISGFSDYSFLQGANVLILVATLIAIYEYLSDIVKCKNKTIQLLIILVISSIPAIANISATAKPDILGFFYVLCAFIFASRYYKYSDAEDLIFTYVSLALCTGTKQTYILWGGLLFLWVTICLIIKLRKEKKIVGLSKIDICFGALSIFAIIGIHYRTFKLTGFPVYPIGLNTLNKMFEDRNIFLLKDYVMFKNEMSVGSYINRIYNFVFDPQPLEHVIMLWTSNVAIIFILLFIYYKRKEKEKKEIALCIMLLVIMVYYMISLFKPDGNYFIAPIVIIILTLFNNMEIKNEKKDTYVVALLFMTTVFMIPIMFVSHSSWAWGTSGFSSEVVPDNFDTIKTNQNIFAYNGISQIADEVSNYSVEDKVLSSGVPDGSYFRLECNLETFAELSQPILCNSAISQSYDFFVEYLDKIQIKAIIIDNEDTTPFVNYVKQYVEQRGCQNIIEDEGAVCYVFR